MNGCQAFACATQGCGHTIHLHHDLEKRLRTTSETFYCPAGHHNYFPKNGETDQAKISRLEREAWELTYQERKEWRIRAKTCPFACGFRSKRRIPESITADLVLHMVEGHGADMPAPVEEAVEA